jgi:hypothetical protein
MKAILHYNGTMNRHSLATALVLFLLVSVAGMQTAVAQAKPEKTPSKPLPCEGGKLLVRHAYSECAPDGFWHVVEDDYYDCPPTKKFRVWDAPTDQPCKGDKKVPAPNPIGTGYVQFNGSGCSHSELVGTMDVYECENGVWSLNTYEVFDCEDGRKLVKLKDRKLTNKPCNEPPPELDLPKITASAVGPNELRNPLGGQTCNALVAAHQIKVEILGTGETIGHVADVKIDNLTDQPISFSIPPVVLESGSGKNQDYVVPQGENVALRPHESKTVPMDGVCVNRHKPPVGKGIGGDLIMDDPTGNVPQDSHSHLKRNDSDKLMRIAKSKYDAADKLEEDGALKDMPYKDKKKRKEIVEQWSMWTDPRISEIEGGPPATKDDLKKVVEKQVGKVPPDKQKEIDKGIDKIFEKIELTTEKAKDLEQPAGENVPPQTTFNVSDETPTPQPQTQEKKKKGDKKKDKKKKWPKPIQDWLDKKNASEDAETVWNKARSKYWDKVWEYGKKLGPHTQDLSDKAEAAKKKANEPGATQADQAAAEQAAKELDKQMKELEKDYQKTPEGKGEFDKLHEAEKAKDAAKEAEKDAEKKLPPGIDKDAVQREEDLRKAVPAVW